MRKLVEFNLTGKIDFALFKKYLFYDFVIFVNVSEDLLAALSQRFRRRCNARHKIVPTS